MPELKVSRSYHEALRRIGVQNPGEVGIQVPVLLTAAVDDFTHLVAPVSVTVAFGSSATTGTILEHSGGELQAGPGTRGVFFTFLEDSANFNQRLNIHAADDPPTFDVSPADVLFTGPAPLSRWRNIRQAATPTSGAFLLANRQYPMTIFLAPGQRLRATHILVNTTSGMQIQWREVPATGAVEP